MKIYIILISLFIAGETLIAQITPEEAAAHIQKGINMGNTLEPPLEGGWNNPTAREIYFDLYRDAGFDLVRIPVRWDMHTGSETPYSVNPTWMQRVEQIVDWALERDLYVIINAHHDNWIKENYSNALYRARFDSIWSQIAIHFRDKPDKLMFEILNEPHGLAKSENDELHARVLSIIRRSNPTRIVIIQGNEWGGAQELIEMAIPEDDYLIGSFHTYDPWPFGLEGHGPFGLTEIRELDEKFASVRAWSDQHGIPVLLGEFGCHRDAEYNQRMKHYKTYMDLIDKYGFIFSVWDDGGNFGILQRPAYSWNEIKDILIHYTQNSPANPKLAIYQDTLIKFSWSHQVNDYDSLVIQRRTIQTTFESIAEISSDSTQYIDMEVVPGHDYYYRILGRYSNDSSIYSQPVTIFLPEYVEQERGYFLGEPLPIPGIIEAEYFDLGGEGKAYHDLDRINIKGDFRPDEGVDIYDRLGEGYHIGNALPGEWLEYTVEVDQENDYLMEVYLASTESGGRFTVKVGEVSTDTLESISSGSWLKTSPVSAMIHLNQGIQVMRFSVIEEPRYNFDKIEFSIPGTTNQLTKDFRLSVNPTAARQLSIRIHGSFASGSIRILDMQGKLLLQYEELGPGERYISEPLPPGIYIVQASEGKGLESCKVVVP